MDEERGHPVFAFDDDDPEEFYYTEEDDINDVSIARRPTLSTISERSERTEDSRDWPRVMEYHQGQRDTQSSWTTDYGQIIGAWAPDVQSVHGTHFS